MGFRYRLRRGLQSVLTVWFRLRNAHRGSIYGYFKPGWWPERIPWWFGPNHPFDGQQVHISVLGQQYCFIPVAYGRFRGHRYDGHLIPDTEQIEAYLEQAGLPIDDAPIFSAVSTFEGGFDSIQTYDRAKFSWGFIQFSATNSLIGLLQNIKAEQSEAFERYFQRYGIDIHRGLLVVRQAKGAAALNQLHDDPRLWKHFVVASIDEAIQRVQVKTAYNHYYLTMLSLSVSHGANQLQYRVLFKNHRYGRAILFDRAVHRGIVYTARLFKRAAEQANAQSTDEADLVLQTARSLEPVVQHLRWDKLKSLLDAH